jgi:hypothetical protein
MFLVESNDVSFLDKKECLIKNTEAWLVDTKTAELEDSRIQVPKMLATIRSRTVCVPFSCLEHKD